MRVRNWGQFAAYVIITIIAAVAIWRAESTRTEVNRVEVNTCRQGHPQECRALLRRLQEVATEEQARRLGVAAKPVLRRVAENHPRTKQGDRSQGGVRPNPLAGRTQPPAGLNPPKRGRTTPRDVPDAPRASAPANPSQPQSPAPVSPTSSPLPLPPGVTGATGLTGAICTETDKLLKVPGC